MSKWTPIKEEFPPIGKNILVCDIDGDIYLTHRLNCASLECYDDIGDKIKNIVAWCPLPEPYKERDRRMRKRFGFTEGFMIGGIIMGLLAFVISSYMAKYFWSEEYTNYLRNMENIQRYSYCPYCGEELEIGFKDK